MTWLRSLEDDSIPLSHSTVGGASRNIAKTRIFCEKR